MAQSHEGKDAPHQQNGYNEKDNEVEAHGRFSILDFLFAFFRDQFRPAVQGADNRTGRRLSETAEGCFGHGEADI